MPQGHIWIDPIPGTDVPTTYYYFSQRSAYLSWSHSLYNQSSSDDTTLSISATQVAYRLSRLTGWFLRPDIWCCSATQGLTFINRIFVFGVYHAKLRKVMTPAVRWLPTLPWLSWAWPFYFIFSFQIHIIMFLKISSHLRRGWNKQSKDGEKLPCLEQYNRFSV